MKNFFKIGFLALIIVVAGTGFFVWRNSQVLPEPKNIGDATIVPAQNQQAVSQPADNSGSTASLQPAPLPSKILINVPFTTQAPLGVWDAYHEEACEEASLIMIKYFLDKKPLTPNIAEQEIQSMIAFEIKNYGNYIDTSAEQNVQLAADFYGIKNLKVVYDFTKDDLKKQLALGKPIIIPAAGRMLGNPNFTQPGPLYHNLVLVGYDGNTIITNDPGTRKGQSYRYDINVLYNAIHDFPGDPNNITQGRKAMIIIQ
jgi:hypothetical protein